MSRSVTYQIVHRPDGRFDIVITTTTGKTFEKTKLENLAAVAIALQNLQAIITALNLELIYHDASARL